jgi:hypothetical protein
MELKFDVIEPKIFLKINTGWLFSYDGYRLIRGPRAKTLSTKFLSTQKNSQNFNEIRFWAWFLSEDGKKIKMDFGDLFVEIDIQPFSTAVAGGVFADYTSLSPIIRSPPKIFEEETSKEGELGESE